MGAEGDKENSFSMFLGGQTIGRVSAWVLEVTPALTQLSMCKKK